MNMIPFLCPPTTVCAAMMRIKRKSDNATLWQACFSSNEPIPMPSSLDLAVERRFGGYTVTLEWSE